MSRALITEKTLERLAELARIKLKKEEEEKLLKDLAVILDYFEELKKLNTDGIEPLTGGTAGKNVWRADEPAVWGDKEKLIKAFPEKEGDYLKVPPVFE